MGLSRKALFLEWFGDNYTLLIADERLPAREKVSIKQFSGGTVEDILTQEGITKESIYSILPPTQYFRNTLSFPFSELQKIEAVVKYEVRDYLPFQNGDYLTDIYPLQSGHEVLSFTVGKDELKAYLERFGRYRENVKAVIPFEIAIYYGAVSLVEHESFIFMDIHDAAVYVLSINRLSPKCSIFLRKNDEKQYRNRLLSELLMLSKISGNIPFYINTRAGTSESFIALNKEVLEETKIPYRSLPFRNLKTLLTGADIPDGSELVSVFGALQGINQPLHKKVNLLKEEFKPRLRRYVRVKDLIIVGSFLFLLFIVSTINLLLDLRFKKVQISELERGIKELSMDVFKKPITDVKEAQEFLKEIQEKISVTLDATNRRYSGVQLLKELSSSLPMDIVVEYTDIVIEKEHIKFSGKTGAFSDIDRIKEALKRSEYFKEVRVTNTGTTGSTEGFTVSFVFDIEIEEE